MPEIDQTAADGRPSITAAQFSELRRAYSAKFGPSKAARVAKVHRNTASMYFKLLRSGASISLKVCVPRIPRAAEPARSRVKPHKRKHIISPAGRRQKLFYPYVSKSSVQCELIAEVNSLVPSRLEPDLRADICQDILVAVLGGLTTIPALKEGKDNIRHFIKLVYRNNFDDDGNALSFNLGADYSDDEIASNIAAEQWWSGEFYDRGKHEAALRVYVPPTQIEDVYRSQVRSVQAMTAGTDAPLSFEEADELLNGTKL